MTSRDTRRLLDRLARHPGWGYTLRKAGHYRVTGPGVLYFTGSTPSDRRALRNLRHDLRRMGAPV